MSQASIQSDLGLVARRTGVKLSSAEFGQAEALVRAGKSPAEAVAELKAAAPATPPPAAPAKPHLSAAESTELRKLRVAGKSYAEAMEMIEAQRLLARSFGTPSGETVRQRVKDRNKTGRWSEDEP
jgi:predicted RNase H-like HicB family nuclease